MSDLSANPDVEPVLPAPASDGAGRPMELLAPAGDPESLQAALAAGAGAVYFGLTVLNARRRARNFTQDEVADAVATVHARGARAFLTLNIDLAQRELESAARLLELARRVGFDAVLVRDPALLAFLPDYPELEFHFSTQNCITSSADVAAAAALGARRVVLAREMSLAEIATASAVPGIETEVFVQGALCFSVSGRCLMSSWVGGRSGNRGSCTSPCRVPWTVDGAPAGTPLSMYDLSAAARLDELRRAGVRGLKIEGRMKNAAWVARAVELYRRALDGANPEELERDVRALGDYTGRQMTCGYLDAKRDALTGMAGRQAFARADQAEASELLEGTQPEPSDDGELQEESAGADAPREPAGAARAARVTYRMDMIVGQRGIACRCECGGVVEEWSLPKSVVRRPQKSASIGQLLAWLEQEPVAGCPLGEGSTNDPDFILVPRAVNGLVARIGKIVQRGQKNLHRIAAIELPESVRLLLDKPSRCAANRTPMGSRPDRVRLAPDSVELFLSVCRQDGIAPEAVIVEGLSADRVKELRSLCGRTTMIAALPSVFFEDHLPEVQTLARECARIGVTVEVNSWGGWHLAREAGTRMEAGPGLSVLNALAARTLLKAGVQNVTLSPEADRRQLEDLTAQCPAPTSLIVFGRPALMTSRVDLPEEQLGRLFEDRRETRVTARREWGLWVFRPQRPYDLRDIATDRICVKHLVVDLVASPDPLGEWSPAGGRHAPFRFNFDRVLA